MWLLIRKTFVHKMHSLALYAHYMDPHRGNLKLLKIRSRTGPLPLENMDIPRIPQLKIAGLHMNDYSQYWFQISTPVPKTSTSLF